MVTSIDYLIILLFHPPPQHPYYRIFHLLFLGLVLGPPFPDLHIPDRSAFSSGRPFLDFYFDLAWF